MSGFKLGLNKVLQKAVVVLLAGNVSALIVLAATESPSPAGEGGGSAQHAAAGEDREMALITMPDGSRRLVDPSTPEGQQAIKDAEQNGGSITDVPLPSSEDGATPEQVQEAQEEVERLLQTPTTLARTSTTLKPGTTTTTQPGGGGEDCLGAGPGLTDDVLSQLEGLLCDEDSDVPKPPVTIPRPPVTIPKPPVTIPDPEDVDDVIDDVVDDVQDTVDDVGETIDDTTDTDAGSGAGDTVNDVIDDADDAADNVLDGPVNDVLGGSGVNGSNGGGGSDLDDTVDGVLGGLGL